MKLKNILLVVEDVERSRKFYHDLFGLDVILDLDGNVILTEGLVLPVSYTHLAESDDPCQQPYEYLRGG